MLSDVSQTQKDKHCVTSLTYEVELTQAENRTMVTRGGRGSHRKGMLVIEDCAAARSGAEPSVKMPVSPIRVPGFQSWLWLRLLIPASHQRRPQKAAVMV